MAKKKEKDLAGFRRLFEAVTEEARAEDVHTLAALIDDFGYDSSGLEELEISFEELVSTIQDIYAKFLIKNPEDPIAHNNAGVFFANRSQYDKARLHFESALQADDSDATIHENLRVVDILTREPKQEWHKVPDVARGNLTLLAYFDPHAM